MTQNRSTSKGVSSTKLQADVATIIGRDPELQRLAACAKRLETGRGGFALVTAPAGMGKTRIIDSFAESSELAGSMVVRVRLEQSAPRPYEIWRQAANDLVELGHAVPVEMTPVYRIVLGRLLRSGGPSHGLDDQLPALGAEQTRYRLYDTVWQFLKSAAGHKPVIVLIDDLQHADAPSLKLLRHVLAFMSCVPILIVAACDDSDPGWTQLSQLRSAIPTDLSFEYIGLSGLASKALYKLIACLGPGDSEVASGDDIAEVTRGSPLHVRLVASLLAAHGNGSREWTVSDLRLLAPSAGRTFAQIASDLPPPARRVLQVAAIFPGHFRNTDIETLAATDAASTASILSTLVASNVLEEEAAGVLRYRHPLFRTIMLENLDPYTRTQIMDRAIALRSGSDKHGDDVWELADWSHATRAASKLSAGWEHCRKAAQLARQLSSPELAAHYFEKELELRNASGGTDTEALTEHAIAAMDMGNFHDAADSAWRAIETLKSDGDASSTRIDALVDFATRFHDAGAETSLWSAFRDEAMAALGDTRDLRWAQLRLLDGGDMEKLSGPPLEVGRWVGLDPQAVEIARDDGTENDYCRTLFVYDWHSVENVDALLERAAHWSSPANIARALSVAAETLMYRHGDFDRACALLERQRSLHEETGSIVEQAKSLVRLTMAQLAAGEPDEAVATRVRARDMVDRLGPEYLIYEHAGTTRGGDLYPEISMESNFAWYIGGDWEAVAEHWAQAIRLAEPGGSPVHVVEAAMAAQAYARIDRFEDARYYLDELTTVLRQLEPRDWAFNGAVGRASHAIWDMAATEYAQDYRGFALEMLGAGVSDWTNTSLELTVARMSTLLGHADEARAYFDAARMKLAAKDHDPRRAIIDFDEAVSLRLLDFAQDPHRQTLLATARSTFAHRNMADWQRRLDIETGSTEERAIE